MIVKTYLAHCLLKPKWYSLNIYETQIHDSCLVQINVDEKEVFLDARKVFNKIEHAVEMELFKQNKTLKTILTLSEIC